MILFQKITLATTCKMVWRRGKNKDSDLFQRLLQFAGQEMVVVWTSMVTVKVERSRHFGVIFYR